MSAWILRLYALIWIMVIGLPAHMSTNCNQQNERHPMVIVDNEILGEMTKEESYGSCKPFCKC